jgi:hypothetical protein
MEQSFVEARVLAANERLGLAQEQLELAIQACNAGKSSVDVLNGASNKMREARTCIDEVRAHIEATAEVAPPMRDCPACKKSVRAQATLCGYCWTISPSS